MDADMQSGHGGSSEESAGQACAFWQPLMTLLAAGELDRAQEERVATHLASCPACSVALARERELLVLLGARRREPDAALLASCRASLADALDREEERGWLRRTVALLLPTSWLAPRPAWSAAVLLIIGFSVGFFGPRLLRHPAAPAPPQIAAVSPGAPATGTNLGASQGSGSIGANPAAPAAAQPRRSAPAPLDLRSADVAAIRVLPSGGEAIPRVELQFNPRQPVTLQGAVDDDDVKGVLLDIVRHSGRYPDGVRLDALGLLRSCNADPEVRAVLCRAARADRSPAVRLKALEALSGAAPEDIIRQTLLDALAADDNPGVRIQAVTALRDMAARGQMLSDPRALAVLRDRMANDPNASVRLQSAAALRDLAPPSSANLP